MESYIKKSNQARIHYDALTPQAPKKILKLENYLKFDKFFYEGGYRYSEVYYDTPENLLSTSGIILSKVYTRHKIYFKVEKESFLPNNFKKNEKEVFIQPCSLRDEPIEHSFALIDAITAAFGTQFTIDLENIIKKCTPKMKVDINAKLYKVLSGTSFKAKVFLEKITFSNSDTKRKVNRDGVTVELDCSLSFMPEFENFTKAIEKYCKELIPYNETRYNILKKVTKPVEITATAKVPKKKKEKKARVKLGDDD